MYIRDEREGYSTHTDFNCGVIFADNYDNYDNYADKYVVVPVMRILKWAHFRSSSKPLIFHGILALT